MLPTAWVFPGQGSQYVGMGKELAAAYPECGELFAQADSILGFSISGLCFKGPEEELKQTPNTQPAILTHSVAVSKALHQAGLSPSAAAGHSLGAYSALVETEVLSFPDALRLVRRRGELMESAGQGRGTMAVILGLEEEKVREACLQASANGIVEPANVNCPGQIVISGDLGAVSLACEKAKALGAKRAMVLPVSGPFHSSLMKPAADEYRKTLSQVTFHEPKIPYVSDIDAVEIKDPSTIRESLVRQLQAPVQWIKTVETLSSLGLKNFIEVGPGKVLNGLIGKILRDAAVQSVGDPASFQVLTGAL
jgi:[acyl-carrier-protein] S-malonyltransferase